MDLLTLGYYAFVCALLGLAAPLMHNRLARLAIGATVGLAAASLLPSLRLMIGSA